MTDSADPRCAACGEYLVLQLDPASLPVTGEKVLLADPPYRYGCESPDCSRAQA